MLDLRRLNVFREVATRRSFSGAAQALSYTQSTVSQAVAELERELGVTLLDRSSRPVRPTHAGELVLERAAPLLGQARLIEDDLAALRSGDLGRLRLGAFLTAWATFVPAAVATFAAAHPQVELAVEQHEPAAALRRLAAGELDVAVIYRFDDPEPGPRFVTQHLCDDPYALVLPAGHRLARRRTISIADLAGERWILPPRHVPFTQAVLALCRAHGFEPMTAYETAEVAMAQPLVASGLVITLLPHMNLERPHPGVAVRALADGSVKRSVWAVRPAARTVPAVRRMLAALQAAAQD